MGWSKYIRSYFASTTSSNYDLAIKRPKAHIKNCKK